MTPLEALRHSSAHILATAVLRLFPDAKLDIGPPTETGFYYDFDLEHQFTPEDLKAIEKEMQKVISEKQDFVCKEVSREEALKIIEEIGQPYKVSRLEDIPEGDEITFYQNGEFVDLCAGPHVENTKEIRAIKLLSVAGAYYRGNENNKQLQRIYGTAFPSKEELKAYVQQLAEAKKRDHRKLGKELELFQIDEQVGQGLILWQPKGTLIRQELQKFISQELLRQGYQQVITPHIGKLDLYRTSGHFPYYKDSQYPPIVDRETLKKFADEKCTCADLYRELDEGSIQGYMLKPMNCPMHIKIFESSPHSYRDLPVRLAEFGTVYRWEQSGELNGMTRVRGFTQDDAHIFCTEDQVGQEIELCLELVQTIFNVLGMKDFRVRIGLRDPDSSKYGGKAEAWDKAENALRKAAEKLGAPFSEEPGEAAFYGPKIDFVVRDVIGREWQLGTIQVDYTLPERFDLSYVGADNQPHRPVMIHRAPFGSMERFMGILIEHFAGNFPTWLAPEQVRLLPINDELVTYANEVAKRLQDEGIRVSVDSQSDKLGAKIRRAEKGKIPHMLVLGAKEAENQEVSVRSRANKSFEGNHSIDDFVKMVVKEVSERSLPETA